MALLDKSKIGAAITKSPSVIDFKIIQKESHARANQLVVPFNVPRISAVVLLTERPHEDPVLRQKAFLMAFKADGKPL